MTEDKRIYLDEDTMLMMKASRGDKKAYAVLYSKYFSAVTRFLASMDGQLHTREDISQEVFYRIWKNREKYQPNSTFKTFLFACAKNILYEHKSKSSKEIPLSGVDYSDLLPIANVSEASAGIEDEAGKTIRLLGELMSQLPDKQQNVFKLTYLSGMSSHEIAKLLGCSLHSVHQSLHLARKTLRKLTDSHSANSLEVAADRPQD